MNALAEHLRASLRLHFRNRLALLYGYLFPLIFLVAFQVLYRHEEVPLLRHMGELLTVAVLGGACFGLPTTLVSERERGVWRRYRFAPLPAGTLVTSTIIARYFILLTAGLLQLGVALMLGLPLPLHPLALWVAFTCASFAFIGLGLVIATLADDVPAVQALGQCLFLPMLIIGGVAVPLTGLPSWAQHLSAFLPGRYAVEALQAGVTGRGLGDAWFSLLALGLTGVAGCLTGTKLFRWDAQQSFRASGGKCWLAPALAAWVAVGVLAEWRGRVVVAVAAGPPPLAAELPAPPPQPDAVPSAPEPPWTKITTRDIESLDYRVPPDNGVVTPIAPAEEESAEFLREQVDSVSRLIATWPPGSEGDDLDRVRHLLCLAAVADVLQLPVERHLPRVVYRHLADTYPRENLIRILAHIALHPGEGPITDSLSYFGIEGAVGDAMILRERAYLYAIKFLARLTGRVDE